MRRCFAFLALLILLVHSIFPALGDANQEEHICDSYAYVILEDGSVMITR